jgi:hypothetical protein
MNIKLQKRPYKVALLAGLFLGAAFLKIVLFRFYPSYSWQYLLVIILPSFFIYVSLGALVFTKWPRLSFLQKAIIVGIGIHYILNLLYSIATEFFFMDRSIYGVELWLSYYFPEFILNPLDNLYNRYIIMSRTTHLADRVVITIYPWETGLLFPIMGTVYSGFVGFCFGKLILSYRNGYLTRLVKEWRQYSVISLISIFTGIFGYVLAFASDGYFLIFFLLSILSIVFGHISKKRIMRSNFQLKGKRLSIVGLLIGYTLLATSIVIFIRFNNYFRNI